MRKQVQMQNVLILIASYFFYGLWDYRFLSLIIISSAVDFVVGKRMHKETNVATRKWLLGISLFVNLGFLLVFKYYNFFVDSFTDMLQLFGVTWDTRTLNVILPVGISFYTFQTLSYTIDIYRKKLEPSNNVINFFAYVAFFPQLVAGPIERASNLLPQFAKERNFNYTRAVDGLRQILWGFFKKVAIADVAAIFVNQIFADYQSLSGLIIILGVILFAIQIYGDFSGYSDIAIGTARLLGFDLMQNFAFPYFSRDIAEFWRRWHISLSTWFRDYLYIPLGGSRGGMNKTLRNVIIIFVVSGFWHGANWTFVVWGLLNGLFFIPLLLGGRNRNNLEVVAQDRKLPTIREVMQILFTFGITCFAWIFFRAESISHAFYMIKNTFTNMGMNPWASFKKLDLTNDNKFIEFPILILLIGVMLVFEWLNRRNKHGLEKIKLPLVMRWGLYLVLVFIVIEYFYSNSAFIYFQF
ncbi:MAG: MBOAT family O-acyltransferase [Bacteroidota bacterium]